MILLDTDTVTLYNHGHPQILARLAAASDEVALTVVSRIEVLRGRWDFLLKAADGSQLERAQLLLQEAEQSLNEFDTVSIDAAAALSLIVCARTRNSRNLAAPICSSPRSRWQIGQRSSPAICATSVSCSVCNWRTGPTLDRLRRVSSSPSPHVRIYANLSVSV